MKKLLSSILVISVMVIFSSFVSAEMKETYELKGGAMGKVTFNHKAHQDMLKDCKICHHKDEAGKEQACYTCHTKDSKVKPKDAFHNNCQKCHKEMKKGPTGCKDCHKK